MNVILLDNVENLGRVGDLVKVKPGYGRNHLLPQGKAVLATPGNIKAIEARRAELEKAASEELATAKACADAYGQQKEPSDDRPVENIQAHLNNALRSMR